MSWAALNRELQELLARLALSTDLEAARGLVDRCMDQLEQGGQAFSL